MLCLIQHLKITYQPSEDTIKCGSNDSMYLIYGKDTSSTVNDTLGNDEGYSFGTTEMIIVIRPCLRKVFSDCPGIYLMFVYSGNMKKIKMIF